MDRPISRQMAKSLSEPRRPGLRGTVRMPGDKSISHRALILSALAVGRSTIAGLNEGADVRATVRVLAALGARLSTDDSRGLVEAYGRGWPALAAAREPL